MGLICGFVSMQDFFQMLRPGLQLLRPPKKDARGGPGVVASFVAYNSEAFREEFGVEPWQACSCFCSYFALLVGTLFCFQFCKGILAALAVSSRSRKQLNSLFLTASTRQDTRFGFDRGQ